MKRKIIVEDMIDCEDDTCGNCVNCSWNSIYSEWICVHFGRIDYKHDIGGDILLRHRKCILCEEQ